MGCYITLPSASSESSTSDGSMPVEANRRNQECLSTSDRPNRWPGKIQEPQEYGGQIVIQGGTLITSQ